MSYQWMSLSETYLRSVIETYGYPAIIIGTIVEGETVLVLAGMLSFLGYLELHWVIPAAFLGSFGGDQFFFYLGRYKGQTLLYRHTKWMSRLERIHRLIKRFHDAVILGFRFLYGFRLITPLVLGMDREVRAGRFALLNGLSAAVWSCLVAWGGYLLGEMMESILKEVKNFQIFIMGGLGLIGLIGVVLKTLKKKAA